MAQTRDRADQGDSVIVDLADQIEALVAQSEEPGQLRAALRLIASRIQDLPSSFPA